MAVIAANIIHKQHVDSQVAISICENSYEQ